MSNLINLGSFNASNGKSAGLGFASGLDSNSIITSILQARTDGVKTLETNITTNGKKASALSELSTLVNTLKTTADFLRGQTGVGTDDSDFFQHTTSSLSTSDGSTASNYLSVTSQAGATISSYKVTNIVTANAQTLRKDGFTSKTDSVVGASSTFTAGTFTLRGSNITLNDGDSLNNIKAKINAVSNSSGVTAEIVQVSTNSYSLILKASTTGLEAKITEYGDGDVGDPAAGALLFGGSTVTFAHQQIPNDASFDLNGVTITRPTNAISDAITGVTFSLLSDTGLVTPPTINVKVSNDTTLLTNGVNNFVTAYNNLKQFISQQSQVDSTGTPLEASPLANESILRDVTSNLDALFSSFVSGITGGNPNSLASVGITATSFPGDENIPKTDNILILDQAKFSSVMTANFDSFRKVFATDFVADSADLGLYKSSNKSSITDYTLDIDKNRAAGDQVRVLDSNGNFLFNADYANGLITGRAGTSLDGEQLVYSGSGVSTIKVKSTQGIADQVFNLADAFLADTGIIATATQALTNSDTQLKSQIEKENNDIATEKSILVAKFTQLEAIVSQANSTLSFLDAQRNSDNSQ